MPHRGRAHSALGVTLGRLGLTAAAAAVAAFGIGLGFHLGVTVAGGRVLVTYPGTPQPGETVLAPSAAGAQFVTAGPAAVGAAQDHLVIDGITTMWSAAPSAPTVVPAGEVLVLTPDGYRVVPRAGVCLASPL